MPERAAWRWQLPHRVEVAMSTAADGDLRQAPSRLAWCRRHGIPPPAVLRQVHGIRVLAAADAPADPPSDGDALVSDGAAIAVFGADCPPLVLAAPDALAVAHCGWRGTAAGMVKAVVAALRAVSRHPPSAWTALIGPGAHPDDYEVDAPVLDARRWPAGTCQPGRPGHGWLDLPAAVAADAAACGLGAVARCPTSTSRDPGLHSHRRDGAGIPQLVVAWRIPPCAG